MPPMRVAATRPLLSTLCAALHALSAAAQPLPDAADAAETHANAAAATIYALATVETSFNTGHVVALGPPPSWTPVPTGLTIGGQATVRSDAGWFIVIDAANDTLLLLDRAAHLKRSIKFEPASELADVLILSRRTAIVSRRASAVLELLDLATGVRTPWVNLAPLDPDDGNPDPAGLIARDGRLYVQLQRLDAAMPWVSADHGALAVIDLATSTILDADPITPGLQPIELDGPHPRLRMAINSAGDRLYVSSTRDFHLDFSGGLELVDLTTLTSLGFVQSEIDLAAMSAFVLTADDEGVLFFHTDIIASSHLVAFDADGAYGGEIAQELGRYFQTLTHDPYANLVLMPSLQGVFHIIDARTLRHIADTPRLTPGTTWDIAVMPPGP